MYQNVKQFTCDICGKTAIGNYRVFDIEHFKFQLPKGWTGRASKHAQCFCDECSERIKREKGRYIPLP